MRKTNQIHQIKGGGFRVWFKCDYCGLSASRKLSNFEGRERHFCSIGCYSRYRKECLPKEEHNRYGTGLPKGEKKRRIKARADLNHAIRDGKLDRLPCSICGNVSEAHHPDYNDPLNVIWLCTEHHWAIYEDATKLSNVVDKEGE